MNEGAENTENTEVIDGNKGGQEPNPDLEIGSKLDALSSFLGKDQVEDFKKEIGAGVAVSDQQKDDSDNGENKQDGEEGGDDKGEEGNGEEKTPEQKEADKKEAEKNAENAKKTEKKSVFGLKKPGEKKAELTIEKPEQILEVINSKFGLDIKEPKDLPKFIELSQGWRAKAEKSEKHEKDFNRIVDFLNEAPEEIIESLKAYEKGEDYMAPFQNKPKFDFNTPVEKQDIKALVNHYYPGKFTEEDLKDENPSELLQMAIDTSKDKFIVAKQAHDSQRANITQRAADQLKAQNLSVASSVARLKQVFPDADEDSIKEVQSVFEGGPNKVLSFFYNEDGTAKPEAAEMFLMARYGKEEIERMMDISSHITETKINEDLLTRGADTKKPVKGSGVTDKISDEEKEKIRELERVANISKKVF